MLVGIDADVLPDEVERYTAIKKAAIAEGKTQPWAYQEAKTPYLIELTERIEFESASEKISDDE